MHLPLEKSLSPCTNSAVFSPVFRSVGPLKVNCLPRLCSASVSQSECYATGLYGHGKDPSSPAIDTIALLPELNRSTCTRDWPRPPTELLYLEFFFISALTTGPLRLILDSLIIGRVAELIFVVCYGRWTVNYYLFGSKSSAISRIKFTSKDPLT